MSAARSVPRKIVFQALEVSSRLNRFTLRLQGTLTRFWVSLFGFQISGFRFRVSDLWCRVPGSGFRVSCFVLCVS